MQRLSRASLEKNRDCPERVYGGGGGGGGLVHLQGVIVNNLSS